MNSSNNQSDSFAQDYVFKNILELEKIAPEQFNKFSSLEKDFFARTLIASHQYFFNMMPVEWARLGSIKTHALSKKLFGRRIYDLLND